MQSFEYPAVRHRLYQKLLVKRARQRQFDYHSYNDLRQRIESVEHDLRRIRDPLYLHLPLTRIQSQQEVNSAAEDSGGRAPE